MGVVYSIRSKNANRKLMRESIKNLVVASLKLIWKYFNVT
jgi:hypothetical protein